MKKKILFFSSNRADLGIIEPVWDEFLRQRHFDCYLTLTGQLLLAKGLVNGVKDKYGARTVARRISTDSSSTGQIVHSFTDAVKSAQALLKKMQPDAILVVGDRFEILGVVIAAYLNRVRIVHLHGGELTFGALDDGFRHSISKLADLHFTSSAGYRKRLLQMGEAPGSIFVSGAPALEKLSAAVERLTSEIHWVRYAVATLHPETRSRVSPEQQARIFVGALNSYNGGLVCTASNNDLGGQAVNRVLKAWVARDRKKRIFADALGSEKYWSCLSGAEFMIGNSSSGILESALLGLPVVNIGDRQKGRERSDNILDVKFSIAAIRGAIRKASSAEFREKCRRIPSPFLVVGKRPSQVIHAETKRFMARNTISVKEFVDL